MGAITTAAQAAFRGDPINPLHKPDPVEIVDLFTDIEAELATKMANSVGDLASIRWAFLSDTQPRTDGTVVGINERAKVQAIYQQINDHASLAGVAGIRHLGDVMHRGKKEPSDTTESYTFADGIEDTRLTGVSLEQWEFIPGNHDKNYGDEDEYKFGQGFDEWNRYFGHCAAPGYRRQGNIAELFLVTEYGGTPGKYPDFQIELLRTALRMSKGCLFLLHTHHPLANTTYNTDPSDPDNVFVESDRIWDLLDEFTTEDLPKVVVLSGHNGTGNATLAGRESHVTYTTSGQSHAVECLQVGLHVPSWANQENTATDHNMSFVVMDATAGSADIVFRRWDVEVQAFLAGADNEITVTAPNPIRIPANWEVNTRRAVHPQMNNLFRAVQTIIIQPVKEFASSIWQYAAEPSTALRLIVTDQLNQDLKAGMGPLIDFFVPAGLAADADAGIRNNRVGGRFGIVKADSSENDQSGEAYFSLSDDDGDQTRMISGRDTGLVIKTLTHAFTADRETNISAPVSTGDVELDGFETLYEPADNAGHFVIATGKWTLARSGWAAFNLHADTDGAGSGSAELVLVRERALVETEFHVDWFYPGEERLCGGMIELPVESGDIYWFRLKSWDAGSGDLTKVRASARIVL